MTSMVMHEFYDTNTRVTKFVHYSPYVGLITNSWRRNDET